MTSSMSITEPPAAPGSSSFVQMDTKQSWQRGPIPMIIVGASTTWLLVLSLWLSYVATDVDKLWQEVIEAHLTSDSRSRLASPAASNVPAALGGAPPPPSVSCTFGELQAAVGAVERHCCPPGAALGTAGCALPSACTLECAAPFTAFRSSTCWEVASSRAAASTALALEEFGELCAVQEAAAAQMAGQQPCECSEQLTALQAQIDSQQSTLAEIQTRFDALSEASEQSQGTASPAPPSLSPQTSAAAPSTLFNEIDETAACTEELAGVTRLRGGGAGGDGTSLQEPQLEICNVPNSGAADYGPPHWQRVFGPTVAIAAPLIAAADWVDGVVM
eukprot:SAG11_NODE_11_length_27870_cov_16.327428_24_plen_332_part_01